MTTTAQPTTPTRAISSAHRESSLVSLCLVIAALLIASGAIHLHLWNQYYRHITVGHMNTLFLIQWILCFVGAVAVLVMRNLLAVVAAGGLMAGTFIGYLFARYHSGGIFGFYLGPHFSSTPATSALSVEIAGTAIALVTGVLMLRQSARARS